MHNFSLLKKKILFVREKISQINNKRKLFSLLCFIEFCIDLCDTFAVFNWNLTLLNSLRRDTRNLLRLLHLICSNFSTKFSARNLYCVCLYGRKTFFFVFIKLSVSFGVVWQLFTLFFIFNLKFNRKIRFDSLKTSCVQ